MRSNTQAANRRKSHCSKWFLVCLAISCVIGGPCLATFGMASQCVRRAAGTASASVQDVGVNHRRTNVLVTQEFLHRANVVAVGHRHR